MLHLYSAANPRRPIEWRWLRASDIAEQRQPPSRQFDGTDHWLRRATHFARNYVACQTDTDYSTLAVEDEVIFWAHSIFTSQDNESASCTFKSEIEARLLAAEPYDMIAARIDTLPAIIEAYENIFFNVRPKLQAPSYIAHQVLGPSLFSGFQEADYDLIWKYCGYRAGSNILDAMIHGNFDTESLAWLKDTTASMLARKAFVALLTLRTNTFNAVPLIEQYLKANDQKSRGAPGSDAAMEATQEMLVASLASMPVKVIDTRKLGDSPFAEYHKVGIELPMSEQLAIQHENQQPRDYSIYRFPDPSATTIDATFNEGG